MPSTRRSPPARTRRSGAGRGRLAAAGQGVGNGAPAGPGRRPIGSRRRRPEIRREHAKVGDEPALAYRLVETAADDEPIKRRRTGPDCEPGRSRRAMTSASCTAPRSGRRLGAPAEPGRRAVRRAANVVILFPVAVSGRLDELAIHGSIPRLAPSGGAVRAPMGTADSPLFNFGHWVGRVNPGRQRAVNVPAAGPLATSI